MGETLKEGMLNSVKIRILAPGKTKAGGKSVFTRFTQHELSGGTSMDIGQLGEAYANFGFFGGLAFMGLSMAVFGLLFRMIYVKFSRATLAFVWVPYVLGQWHQGESAISDCLDYAVKSLVVIALVALLEPAWRRVLMRAPFGVRAKRKSPTGLRQATDAEAP
jgi:hypothetical protein